MLRINRYMLGCKFNGFVNELVLAEELIDTCWDVNEIRYSQTVNGSMELIDTCWDVN